MFQNVVQQSLDFVSNVKKEEEKDVLILPTYRYSNLVICIRMYLVKPDSPLVITQPFYL